MAISTEVTTYAQLTAAVTASQNIVVTASITLTGNVSVGGELTFLKGGKIVTNGYTLTIYSVLNAGPVHIFQMSAVGQVVLSKKSCMVAYPEWWGAIGDGSTEDTTYVRHANAAAGAARIPLWCAQSYYVDEIKLVPGTTIDGWGLFKSKSGTTSYCLSCEGVEAQTYDIVIQNIKVNGNKANKTAGGCILVGGTNCLVENCYIYDGTNNGIQVSSGDNVQVLNNSVYNCGLSTNSWGGIGVAGGKNILVVHNTYDCTDGNSVYGICIEPQVGQVAAGVGQIIVANNLLRGGRIFVSGKNLEDGTLDGVMVHDNIIDARGARSTSLDASDPPVYLRKTSQLSLKNNKIWNRGPTGSTVILGINVDRDNVDFDISDNDLYLTSPNVSTYAIRFMTSANNYGRVGPNSIWTYGTYPVTYGVYSYSATESSYLRIELQRVAGSGPGVTTYCQIGDTNTYYEQPLKKGVTGSRPGQSGVNLGAKYLDTTLDADGLEIMWQGTKYIKADGSNA